MAGKLERKDMNLLPLVRQKEKAPMTGLARTALVLGLVVLVLFGTLFGVYMKQMNGLQQEMEAINNYLLDESVIAVYNEAMTTRQQGIRANEQALYARDLAAEIAGYPVLRSADYKKIEEFCGSSLDIRSITTDINGRVCQLQLQGRNVEDITPFVKQLKDSGLFGDVAYMGYSSTSGGYYQFAVSCLMQEAVQEEEQ